MSDANGYPTGSEKELLRTWSDDDPAGFLLYAQELWHYADWGWPDLDSEVSTGGWSGNEDLIEAMMDNSVLWSRVFVSVRRGGHYRFKVPAAR